MICNEKILLDLFYQCTEYKEADVDWFDCREDQKTFDIDSAILYIQLKCGKAFDVCNQFGCIHVTER
jgi:hypothetical protein